VRLVRMMVVMAALAGAGAILATAGALRAVLVVVAKIWVLTPAFVAVGALRAVPVIAALSADRVLGVPVLAADQSVAAVELRAALSGCDLVEETAGVTDAPAALILWDTCMAIAAGFTELTEERVAIPVETADLAVRAIAIIAA
jgi:hypothetical protein